MNDMLSQTQLDRRQFISFTVSFAMTDILGGSLYAFSKRDVKRPNFVFILADDLGRHQLGCYGSGFYETRNLDNLAREGMRFTNAYAAAPVCSPTRASIMTGKYPARLDLTDYIPGKNPKGKKLRTPDWTKHLPLKETTIAEALKQAGYTTGHFGKWHLNKDKNYKPGRLGDPGSQGFDEVLTTHKPGAGPKSKYENDWHHVREITEGALNFIEKNEDRPFFCYISHNSIHAPEIEKEELISKYRNKPEADNDQEYGFNNPTQAAMLETLDKSIGAIIDKVKELNLEKNTLIVFFSDNGHFGPKDGELFRGSKADLYEGGIRMPLIMSWAGVIKPGSECNELAISNDFFPTFCEIAGVKWRPDDVDGVSLFTLLKNPGARVKREALFWHFPHHHPLGVGPQGAIRKGKYKLIENFNKSTFNQPGGWELYDLENDAKESHNLANELPNVTENLRGELRLWQRQVGAQMMTINED